MILINVRMSLGLAKLAGNTRLRVMLDEGATVADLLDHLCSQYPALKQKLNIAVAIVSGRHATASQTLSHGQEVALLIPIAGG